jgi:hypothetical protein
MLSRTLRYRLSKQITGGQRKAVGILTLISKHLVHLFACCGASGEYRITTSGKYFVFGFL